MDIKVGDVEINEIWWEKKGWDRIKEAIEGKIFDLKMKTGSFKFGILVTSNQSVSSMMLETMLIIDPSSRSWRSWATYFDR